MADKIHIINSFRSYDTEHLKKAVTEKIGKIINDRIKKAN